MKKTTPHSNRRWKVTKYILSYFSFLLNYIYWRHYTQVTAASWIKVQFLFDPAVHPTSSQYQLNNKGKYQLEQAALTVSELYVALFLHFDITCFIRHQIRNTHRI